MQMLTYLGACKRVKDIVFGRQLQTETIASKKNCFKW